MNIELRKTILAFGLLVCLLSVTWPNASMAVSTNHFGGHDLSIIIPCTGGGNVSYVDFFYPLYLDSSVPLGGFMGMPTALTYLNYYIYPGSWALGDYTPGAAVCLVGSCPYCTYMPNYGLILPTTGSSLPGSF